MLETIFQYAEKIDSALWGPWTIFLIGFVGLFLTIKSGFFPIRKFGFIYKNTFAKIFTKSGRVGGDKMTPFQAASTALASTVGMGNIAGVGVALSVGGPGAIFWMWALAIVGMMSKTAEITLAVHYRETGKKGDVHGGPMYYIQKGLGWSFLAKIFSIGIVINSILAASLIQSHTVGRSFLKGYNLNPYITAVILAVITAFVVIGGKKRIGRFCERLVPMMSFLYICAGLIIFFVNYEKIPGVFGDIFRYAFSPAPVIGGFAGVTLRAALKSGITKGMLSNEAGLGTAPMIHACADTDHPFAQGMWGVFEVFIDTIVICTLTAFVILSTGTLSSGQSGIELVMSSFSSVFPVGIAENFISFSILTFCLSSIIGFFVYYETAVINIFGKESIKYLKWIYLVPGIVVAGIADVDKVWIFANIAVAACSIPNLIAVLLLSGVFFKLMKDFLSKKNEYATHITDATKNYLRPEFKND